MMNDKLIYASEARKAVLKADPKVAYCIDSIPGVDAIPMVQIEEVKQDILQTMNNFIEEYNRIGFYGKADVMDIAKRLVNAALTDLCSKINGDSNG